MLYIVITCSLVKFNASIRNDLRDMYEVSDRKQVAIAITGSHKEINTFTFVLQRGQGIV